MSNFEYKRNTVTQLKLAGLIDTDQMTIDVDGDEKNLSKVLSVFNGAEIELLAKIKQSEELELPQNS